MATLTLLVPGISCGHCAAAITEEVTGVAGVESVEVSVEDKVVTVTGSPDPLAVNAAIEEAGYEVSQ
jgi:copper chaperone CopZ